MINLHSHNRQVSFSGLLNGELHFHGQHSASNHICNYRAEILPLIDTICFDFSSPQVVFSLYPLAANEWTRWEGACLSESDSKHSSARCMMAGTREGTVLKQQEV